MRHREFIAVVGGAAIAWPFAARAAGGPARIALLGSGAAETNAVLVETAPASRIRVARRSANYVKRILDGAKPADLPVEQPTRVELSVNLRTAKRLGISIPETILGQADRTIE